MKKREQKCTSCAVFLMVGINWNNSSIKNNRYICKKCLYERRAKYRQKHKNKIKASKQLYYKNNKEKIDQKNKEYYNNNKKNIKIYNKEYRSLNKKKIALRDKSYRENNKEKISAAKKIYLQKNKKEVKKRQKGWYDLNKEHCLTKAKLHRENSNNKKRRNINEKIRRNSDPVYKLRTSMSKFVYNVLSKFGINKNSVKFNEYFNYSIEELKHHLESQFEIWMNWMNWSNWGKYNVKTWDDNNPLTWTWQIDHIIPISNFKILSVKDEEFKRCWGLKNLRPLSAKLNILEGVRRTRHQ